MLKSLLSIFALILTINVSSACTAIVPSPANPTAGQTVNFSLSGCSSFCYFPCFASSGQWTISSQGAFVIAGVTYNGFAQVSGLGVSVRFNSNTTASVTFRANCSSSCNAFVSRQVTIGPAAPPTITRPSTSLVPSDLVNLWKGAGANKDLLPKEQDCINVHDVSTYPIDLPKIVSPFRDGYRVNITHLNRIISNTNTGRTSIVYFQAGTYYFDKSETIRLNKDNLVLSGAGADKTKFKVVSTVPAYFTSGAITFITVNSKKRVGVTCLSINTETAFPVRFLHQRHTNAKFKNRSIIHFGSSNNCWVSGVNVERGYGSTVSISGGHHNEVTNCYFYNHWTLGGSLLGVNSGGTQGYSVSINNSDNNLVENNKMGLSRHNVLIQGKGKDYLNSTKEDELSSGNVVAYNYFYDGEAKHEYGYTIDHPWNITFHGGGKNKNNLVEGNVCEDRLGVDKVKKSNGENNTFYRNVIKTQIEVQRGSRSNCYNSGQIFLGNGVYKRGVTIDRYKIKGNGHRIKVNRKCSSRGSGCTSRRFSVGATCSRFGSNKNDALGRGERLGESCYLASVPSFLSNLPVYNPDVVIPAKNYNSAPAEGCYYCPEMATINNEEPEPVNLTQKVEVTKVEQLTIEQIAKAEQPNTTPLDVLVFPNPTSGKVTIQIAGAAISGNVMFQLFALSGELLDTRNVTLNGQNSFEYDLSKFNTGMYIGTIIDNEKLYRVKIVKQ